MAGTPGLQSQFNRSRLYGHGGLDKDDDLVAEVSLLPPSITDEVLPGLIREVSMAAADLQEMVSGTENAGRPAALPVLHPFVSPAAASLACRQVLDTVSIPYTVTDEVAILIESPFISLPVAVYCRGYEGGMSWVVPIATRAQMEGEWLRLVQQTLTLPLWTITCDTEHVFLEYVLPVVRVDTVLEGLLSLSRILPDVLPTLPQSERSDTGDGQDPVVLMQRAVEQYRAYQQGAGIEALDEVLRLATLAVERADREGEAYPAYLNNLGAFLAARYEARGHPDDLDLAITLTEEAVERIDRTSLNYPTYLSNLGNYLSDRSTLRRAPADLDRAITVTEQAVELTDRKSPDYPARLNNLGSHLSDRYTLGGTDPEDLDRGITLGEQAVELTDRTSPDYPGYLSNLGIRLSARYTLGARDQADLGRAITVAGDAVQAALRLGGEVPAVILRGLRVTHAGRLVQRDSVGDLEAAERELADSLAQQGAELERRPGWQAGLEFLRGKEDVYRLAVRCRLVLAQRGEEAGDHESAQLYRFGAWQAAEQGKGRLYAALLAAQRQALAAPDPELAALEKQIQVLAGEISQLERLIGSETQRGGTIEVSAGQRVRLTALRDAYKAALDALRRADPELASLTAVPPASVELGQAALGRSTSLLLEFYPLQDALVLFLLDAHEIHTAQVSLPTDTLDRATALLDEGTQNGTDGERVAALLTWLGDLLQPALDTLLGSLSTDGYSHLFLVPTGPLHVWPLHLLPYRDGILWDAFPITYLPTADTLIYCDNRVPRDDTHPLLLAPNPDLPATMLEAAHARRAGWQTVVLDRALPDVLQHPGDFALASHVFPDPQRREEVNQVLFGQSPVSALELLRILRGRPDAEHGMLGSCAAHYEAAQEGDSLSGLTRSFLAGGLRSLTTSLWPVDDLVAAYVGCRFRDLVYDEGWASKAAAVRQAVRELREGEWPAIENWLHQQVRLLDGEERVIALGLLAACSLNQGKTQEYLLAWNRYEQSLLRRRLGISVQCSTPSPRSTAPSSRGCERTRRN